MCEALSKQAQHVLSVTAQSTICGPQTTQALAFYARLSISQVIVSLSSLTQKGFILQTEELWQITSGGLIFLEALSVAA